MSFVALFALFALPLMPPFSPRRRCHQHARAQQTFLLKSRDWASVSRIERKKNEFISWFSTILFTLIDFDALSLFPHRRIDAAWSVHSFSSESAMEGKLECVEWLVLKCSQLNWIERLSREFSSSPLSVEWNKESKWNRNNLESFNRFGSSWKRMAAALRCERRWKEKRTFPSSNYIWWYIVERKSIHETAAIRAWAYEIKREAAEEDQDFV